MKITLNLKKHCIETAAKKKYEKLMQNYFKNHETSSKEEREKMEEEMEHLLWFLENGDFAFLRFKYPQLGGIEDISVLLTIDIQQHSILIQVKFKEIICLRI